MELMKLSPISSLNRQLPLIPSFCQNPEAQGAPVEPPSQMLGTQPGPLLPGAGPLLVGRGCWPSHRVSRGRAGGRAPGPCGALWPAAPAGGQLPSTGWPATLEAVAGVWAGCGLGLEQTGCRV